jgi:valyl-tRNA synthetase
VAAGATADALRAGARAIRELTGSEEVAIAETAERPAECAVAILADAEIILPLAGLIDREAEIAKQRKAMADLERQIGAIRAKLDNAAFVERAPAHLVEQQRTRLRELLAQADAIALHLGALAPR